MGNTPSDFSEAYDIIIVGAGPAGCVLANRLSAHAERQILLLEAGPDAEPGCEHPDIRDPFPLSSDNADFHWPAMTAETNTAIEGDPEPVSRPYTKGYGVGGGSNVNGMGADRALPEDYDEWRSLGAENWGWNDVLPFFKKMERDLDFARSNPLLHGDNGPMPVRRLPRSRWAPFPAAIGNALQAQGFNFLEDYMTDFREGFSGVPTNSLLQGRVSTSMAYLTREVRARSNLSIVANARVDRIDLQGQRATGVFVERHGAISLVRGRQIILCCGAIQSPVVLMRSGIGPGVHLQSQGIAVAVDLRGVGENLQNHPTVVLTAYLPRYAFQPIDNPWFLQNWLRFSSGYPGCGHNDMHLMPFNRTAWHALGTRVGMIAITVLQSKSKGQVSFSGAGPAAPAQVRFNLLSDSRDFERLVAGLRFTLRLLIAPEVATMRRQIFAADDGIVANLARRTSWNAFKAKSIAAILDRAPLRRILLRNARIDIQRLLNDDDALRDFVRHHASPQLHDCGTCRMGRAEDPDAVVDSIGRVHGTEALHVVDASIFPTVPRGYPHFIVIMAAEKIADAIVSGWKS